MQAKGNEAFQSGKHEEAIQHFTEAIKLAPGNHVLYSNRSAAYVRLLAAVPAQHDHVFPHPFGCASSENCGDCTRCVLKGHVPSTKRSMVALSVKKCLAAFHASSPPLRITCYSAPSISPCVQPQTSLVADTRAACLTLTCCKQASLERYQEALTDGETVLAQQNASITSSWFYYTAS